MISPATGSASPAGAVLTDLGAARAVDAMRKGEIKAEDYARALVDRAEALTRLNAFRTLIPERVIEAAREADARRAAGAALGGLHGLPIPIKDSVNTRSLPTSYGTAAFERFTPASDAAIVRRLLDEGALVMGKTNLHELSFGWTSDNGSFGAVRNPYDPSRIPGGSSGGSGVAVAARMAPLALAEDTWASIRLPAAFCGLAGLRPTYGRYPDEGIMPLTTMFDQVGPLARSVEDIALFDSAVTRDGRPLAPIRLAEARIGVPRAFFWDGLDPEIERIASDALRRLREGGAVIADVATPDIVTQTSEIAATIIGYEAQGGISKFLRDHDAGISFGEMLKRVSPNVRGALDALALPPNRPTQEAYATALAKRTALRSQILAWFEAGGLSALVFPAAMAPPPLIGEDTEIDVAGRKTPLSTALARNMALGSCAGMASLILPAGLTSAGLPVGLEFVALPGKDRELLTLGLSVELKLGPIPGPKV